MNCIHVLDLCSRGLCSVTVPSLGQTMLSNFCQDSQSTMDHYGNTMMILRIHYSLPVGTTDSIRYQRSSSKDIQDGFRCLEQFKPFDPTYGPFQITTVRHGITMAWLCMDQGSPWTVLLNNVFFCICVLLGSLRQIE